MIYLAEKLANVEANIEKAGHVSSMASQVSSVFRTRAVDLEFYDAIRCKYPIIRRLLCMHICIITDCLLLIIRCSITFFYHKNATKRVAGFRKTILQFCN